MNKPWQSSIALSAVLIVSALLLSANAFGQQSPEFEILCPPNAGISSNGGFSNEPLKQDLKTGNVTRLTSVERAIAFKACDQDVAISDLADDVAEAVILITCSDQQTNGDETDVDCGGSCPNQCSLGDTCLVNADCGSNFCGPSNSCELP